MLEILNREVDCKERGCLYVFVCVFMRVCVCVVYDVCVMVSNYYTKINKWQ